MITILLALALAETFTGTITDTMCGAKHTMMKDQPDDKCIRMCVKESSEYCAQSTERIFSSSTINRSPQNSPPRK